VLPFAALGALAARTRPAVLVIAAAAAFAIDLAAARFALLGNSSTAAVGLIVASAVSLLTIVPTAALTRRNP
jgi:hypothetical protein